MSEISKEMLEVFREVFEDESLDVTRATSASDVSGWDSLMHVILILRLEKAFGIRFFSEDVAMLRNAGELQDLVDARVGVR